MPEPEEVDEYAQAHTTPPDDLLQRLCDETHEKLSAPQMLTGPVEGRFLEMLVWASKARRVLEIGTYSGYSALSMAAALPDDGELITCDVWEEAHEMAKRYAAESPHGHKIDFRLGPALETIDDARGAVRPRLHRRRQGELRQLLPRGAAAARRPRPDRVRQHALERPRRAGLRRR